MSAFAPDMMQKMLDAQADNMKKQIEAAEKQHGATLRAQKEAQEKQLQQQAEQHKEAMEAQEGRTTAQLDAMKAQNDAVIDKMAENAVGRTKAVIGKLKDRSDYDMWIYAVEAELKKAEIFDTLQEQMKGEPVVITDLEKKKLAALASDVRGSLSGDALRICSAKNAQTLADVMSELERWGGKISDVETTNLLNNFNTEKWEPAKQSLEVWIAEKFRLCLRLSSVIVEGAREVQMRVAILNNLPCHFREVANSLRAAPPKSWQEIEKRLKDWDEANSGKESSEIQGTVKKIEAENTSLRKKVEAMEASQASVMHAGGDWGHNNDWGRSGGWNREPKGKGKRNNGPGHEVRKESYCNYCKKKGHWKDECNKKKAADAKKGNKGGGKGDKKKAGGKGNGGKGGKKH